jgi:hypothetical protein
MGIPQEHWHDLWQKVGPELQNINTGNGPLGYQMGQDEWGLRMTPDHKMPREALELIQQTHEEMFGGTGAPSVAPTEVLGSDAPGTSLSTEANLTTSDVQELKGIVGKEIITASDVASHPELFEKLSYVAPNVTGESFASTIGLPDKVWLESLQPYIVDQLDAGNSDYRGVFYETSNGGVNFTGNGRVPAGTIADMLEHIPKNVRESLRTS